MPRIKARGFTLIEVLVALAIVSIGMLVVIQTVSQTANNSSYLRDKTIAHWVAMNQLTLMRLNPTVPTTGTSSDESEMAGQRWRWSAAVTQTAIDSMFRIDVTVRPADSEGDSQLASVTGFVGTKIAKPGVLIAQFTPVAGGAAQIPVPPGGGQLPSPTPLPGAPK
ncbi:MAG TPA: type II secretion system minor pseudopilin GspI [Steroidobacteraceae bacterium]|nr:type II secretion system minor pseudopilin GspI [Steroidobacteraceae bacterium]